MGGRSTQQERVTAKPMAFCAMEKTQQGRVQGPPSRENWVRHSGKPLWWVTEGRNEPQGLLTRAWGEDILADGRCKGPVHVGAPWRPSRPQ